MSKGATLRPKLTNRGLSLPLGPGRTRTIRTVATMLDAAFRIPGTRIRFGWDAILGFLLPGLGDVLMMPIALAPIGAAWKLGASRGLIAKMLLNVAIDAAVGVIPVIGDLFDVYFKANLRNARLLASLDDAIPKPRSA